MSVEALFELIGTLWSVGPDDPVAALLPRDAASLADYYPRLRAFVDRHPRVQKGTIDPAALVGGEVVASGDGSVIEAGAVIHPSCRLVLGPRSRVRSGAVLRDEVVVGPDCLIGVHCEVARSVILGPHTYLGHFVYLADSIVGREVNVAGNVMVANRTVNESTVHLHRGALRFDSRRSHLGALVGDRVRFGASTTVCPGCIIAPDLKLPPGVVLHGTIDAARRAELMRRFFATWVEAPDVRTDSGR